MVPTNRNITRKVAPILNRDCVLCHTPSINPSLPDLTHYATVSEVAHAGGATIPTLVRVSHIHLFGIAFILFFIGKIFLLCDLNVYVKRVAVVIPFAAMLLDVVVLVYYQVHSLICLCGCLQRCVNGTFYGLANPAQRLSDVVLFE